MRDSFEEVRLPSRHEHFSREYRSAYLPQQVVEIQKRKRRLAEVTFGTGQLSEDGIGMRDLVASRVPFHVCNEANTSLIF